jgi:hypothetical protein
MVDFFDWFALVKSKLVRALPKSAKLMLRVSCSKLSMSDKNKSEDFMSLSSNNKQESFNQCLNIVSKQLRSPYPAGFSLTLTYFCISVPVRISFNKTKIKQFIFA